MSQLSKILRDAVDGNGVKLLFFRCPGCNSNHMIEVTGNRAWQWNGDTDKPTFSPSVLVRSGHYADGTPPDKCFLCADAIESGNKSFCTVCHSFVTDGRIQFLSDCTHELAGQTVELPEIS